MKIEYSHSLALFLSSQQQYSVDFKALVLRIFENNGSCRNYL